LSSGNSIDHFAEQFSNFQLHLEKLDTREVLIACYPDGDILYLFNTILDAAFLKKLEPK